MIGLTLRHPVHTLGNQFFVPSGTFLTKEKLDAVISSQRTTSYQTNSLLLHASVKNDLLKLLRIPPYVSIFFDQKQIDDLLNLLETVHLAIPILQTLDYFSQHDFQTYCHILMVFALSTILAKDLITDYQECIHLSSTGPTHDIGKICVPLHILKKTTPLTKTERSFLEHHTIAGCVLLSYYYRDTQNLACRVALDHHERKDSSGYPRGISLEDPLVEIIAVSDIYDALISPRPYRSAPYDNRTALEEITGMAERNQLSLDIVKALIAHNRSFKPHYKEITVSTEKRGTPPLYNVHGIITEDKN